MDKYMLHSYFYAIDMDDVDCNVPSHEQARNATSKHTSKLISNYVNN
jgi:hypothetical protein